MDDVTRTDAPDATDDLHEPTAQERRAFTGSGLGPRLLVETDDAAILRVDGPGAAEHGPLSDAAVTAPEGPEHTGDDTDLTDALALRRIWVSRLTVRQDTELGTSWIVAYLRREGYAILEDVRPDGRHRFFATKRAAALDNIVQSLWAFPEIANVQGRPIDYGIDEWEREAPTFLAGAGILSTVSGQRRARQHVTGSEVVPVVEQRFSVYTLPERNVVVLGRPDGSLSVADTDRRQLRRHLVSASEAERLVHP